MIYTVKEIAEKLNLKNQSKLREVLCLAEFEKKRICDGKKHIFQYELSNSDLFNLENVLRNKTRRINKKLTVREYKLFMYLFEDGLNLNEISEKMNISITTVRKMIDTICVKANVKGSLRLMQIAIKYWRKKINNEKMHIM